LDIADGERIGIIGANGAGKTTLLKVLAGIYKPTRAGFTYRGRAMALINASVGLNADATRRETSFCAACTWISTPREMREHVDQIAEFTDARQLSRHAGAHVFERHDSPSWLCDIDLQSIPKY